MNEHNEGLERQIIELVAADRLDMPISSMSGKLKRMKPKLAGAINLNELGGSYAGQRVYARVENEDTEKARGMKEGIELFAKYHPQHAKILQGMIDEVRQEREVHLYFGVNEGVKLTADDYMGVMKSLGFTETRARDLYPELMSVSRNLSKKRQEERSVMIG